MNNYYNFNDPYQNPQYAQYNFMLKNNMKSAIKRIGTLTGCALILYVIIQNALVLLMKPLGVLDMYYEDPIYQSAVDIVLTVLSLFIPFVLMGKGMKNRTNLYVYQSSQLGVTVKKTEQLMLSKPKSVFDTALGVIAGLGICMAANIVSSIFTVFMSLFGYELSSPDIAMPSGAFGIFMSVIRISIIAALVEELALRGYVMGSLRVYGEKFAIIATSIVFALMHGNLIQAPFALLAGFGLGYLAVKTSSLWTPIIIHALNNLLSVILNYLYETMTAEQVNMIYYCILIALIVAGSISLGILMLRRKDVSVEDGYSVLSFKEKMSAYFLNFSMIISIIYMLVITASFIN